MHFLAESDLINKSNPSSETEGFVHLLAIYRSSGANLKGVTSITVEELEQQAK